MKALAVLVLAACCALAGCASTDFASSPSPVTIKEQFTRTGLMTWGGPVLSQVGNIKIGNAQRVDRTFKVNPGTTLLTVWYLGHRHGPSIAFTQYGPTSTFTQSKPVDMRVTLAPGGQYELRAWAAGSAQAVNFSLVDVSTGKTVASTESVPLWVGPPLLMSEFATPAKVEEAFASAKDCCKSESQFPYQVLPTHGTLNVNIGVDSPLFTFRTGRSYFSAYTLPTTERPLSIVVKSWFHGTVFFPRILLLDASFSQTRVIGPPAVRYVKPAFFEGGHIEATCSIGRNDPARYLIIFTTSADLTQNVKFTVDSTVGLIGHTPVFVPGGTYANDFGPTGDLTIAVSESE